MCTLFGSNKVLKHYSQFCVIPGLSYPELLHEREIHIYLFIKEIKSTLGEPTQHTNTEAIVNGSFIFFFVATLLHSNPTCYVFVTVELWYKHSVFLSNQFI